MDVVNNAKMPLLNTRNILHWMVHRMSRVTLSSGLSQERLTRLGTGRRSRRKLPSGRKYVKRVHVGVVRGRRVGEKICAGLAGSQPEEEGRWV